MRVKSRREAQNGISILKSILYNGLVCSAEELRVTTEPQRLRKSSSLAKDEIVTMQTRACFTHCSLSELREPKVVVQFAMEGECESQSKKANHLELFGPFAIALDPIEARRVGVMPVIYFYRMSHIDNLDPEELLSGSEDLLRRLSEVRQTLIALHIIEERSQTQYIPFIDTDYLEERTSSESLGLSLSDPKAKLNLDRLCKLKARYFIDFFQFDRRTFWQLVDRLEYLLGLFQDTDSNSENSPMAYYEQREWRLPLDFQVNTVWYSLGSHPKIRDSESKLFAEKASQILDLYQTLRLEKISQEKLNATWVLYFVDGKPFGHMIKEIICPGFCYNEVIAVVDKAKQSRRVSDSIKVIPI